METKPEETQHQESFSPWKVVYALLMVHAALGLWVLFVPSGNLDLGWLSIKSTPAKDLFTLREKSKVSLDSIIGELETVDSTLEFIDKKILEKQEQELLANSVKQEIEYPGTSDFKAMEYFFKALMECERSGKHLRILHYGDSQLEGDRISDYLRNRFQLRFGGFGPGLLLPLEPTASMRSTAMVKQSGDWKKMAIYGNLEKSSGGIYGPGGTAYSYSGTYNRKIGEDTIIQRVYPSRDTVWMVSKDTTFAGEKEGKLYEVFVDSNTFYYDTLYKGIFEPVSVSNSWISIRLPEKGAYPRVRKYENLSLLYHSENPFAFRLKSGDFSEEIGVKGARANKVTVPINGHSGELLLSFYDQNPLILGVLLDGDSGIAVDNVPMRGSSGLGFESINPEVLGAFYEWMNVKLIVFQYGINVVPNPRKSYDYYEELLSRQLQAVRKAAPEASILVIGPSDMSRRGIDGYESYPNIPLIRDAMRNAAFRNQCAFWDLYEAMGGENAMLSWVNAKPPLGNKDFTHFSAAGARYVGEMLYLTLMKEFVQYKKQLLQ